MAIAIGMVEFSSVSRGIYSADQMVKISEVEIVTAQTTCPGKYIALVCGDVAAVNDSINMGKDCAGEFFVDSLIIPNVHEGVFPAITGTSEISSFGAVGIIETFSIATMITVADAALKSAEIEPVEIRLGTGLGGKSFFTFTGDVASVKTAVADGMEAGRKEGLLLNAEVIPSPDPEIIKTLM